MVKKCPPGVICIENMTIFMIFIVIAIIIYLLNTSGIFRSISNGVNGGDVIRSDDDKHTTVINIPYETQMPSLRNRSDVLHDPYAPPLKTNSYLRHNIGIPVNVPTQGPIPDYQQIGILTRQSGRETILPLFGRPVYANRDKWQYYTMNDKNNAIKLPVSIQGKSCTGEYGCNSLNSGDNVYVEGYNDIFNATIYENNNIQYIPFIPH